MIKAICTFTLVTLITPWLSGCVPERVIFKDRIVEVPVLIFRNPPPPAPVEKPEFPIDSLSLDATDEETAKAYAETVELMRGYLTSLEESLKPFWNTNDTSNQK